MQNRMTLNYYLTLNIEFINGHDDVKYCRA